MVLRPPAGDCWGRNKGQTFCLGVLVFVSYGLSFRIGEAMPWGSHVRFGEEEVRECEGERSKRGMRGASLILSVPLPPL